MTENIKQLKKKIIVIDFGATKIDYSLVIIENNKSSIKWLKKENTLFFASYDKMCRFIVDDIFNKKYDAVYIAITGPVDEKNGIAYGGPNQFLKGPYKIRKQLQKYIGISGVHIFNDVKLSAEGEAYYWAKMPDFVFVMAGTGIAVETVQNGTVVSRAGSALGELGHAFTGGQKKCNCGRKGCLETVSAGWAIKKYSEKNCNHDYDYLDEMSKTKKGYKFLNAMENAWVRVLEPVLLSVPVSAVVTNGTVGLHPVFIKMLKGAIEFITSRHNLLVNIDVIPSRIGWKAIPMGVINIVKSRKGEKV